MSGGAPPDLLGKDEVASSNLASSSIKQKSAQQSGLFVLFRSARFEDHRCNVFTAARRLKRRQPPVISAAPPS